MTTAPPASAFPPARRVRVLAHGETPLEAVDRLLGVEPQPCPDPASLGPREVLVAVRAAQVGWVDLLMSSGQYQHMAPPPYTPGLEYAGEVLAVGGEVSTWRPGDRIIADGLLTGPRSLGPYQQWGGFAGYALAPEEGLRPLPPSFSYSEGACLLGSYETAWHCLVARGRLQAGETVLVHGATGATGLAAVHLARLIGATVIATGRSPAKLERLRELGAHHVVRTVDEAGAPRPFRDDIRQLTGGRGVEVVYDAVGGDISLESLRCVAFGARFLIVGWASTPFVAEGGGRRGAPRVNTLPTNLIMMKGLDVLGCPTAISTHRDPRGRAARLAALDGWIAEGRLRPVVGATYGFDEVREAMRAKWESRVVGGVVLHPWA